MLNRFNIAYGQSMIKGLVESHVGCVLFCRMYRVKGLVVRCGLFFRVHLETCVPPTTHVHVNHSTPEHITHTTHVHVNHSTPEHINRPQLRTPISHCPKTLHHMQFLQPDEVEPPPPPTIPGCNPSHSCSPCLNTMTRNSKTTSKKKCGILFVRFVRITITLSVGKARGHGI